VKNSGVRLRRLNCSSTLTSLQFNRGWVDRINCIIFCTVSLRANYSTYRMVLHDGMHMCISVNSKIATTNEDGVEMGGWYLNGRLEQARFSAILPSCRKAVALGTREFVFLMTRPSEGFMDAWLNYTTVTVVADDNSPSPYMRILSIG
jgi:hypothetical protein